MTIPLLALLAFALVFLASQGIRQHRTIKAIEQELHQERLRRIAWERAAGLPFWDDQETENALWVRASMGRDELSGEVLATLYFDDDEEFFRNF